MFGRPAPSCCLARLDSQVQRGAIKVLGARYPQWSRVVTGLVGVVGATGLIIGIWFSMVAVAAAILLVATMIGAVYTDLFRGDWPKVVVPATLHSVVVVVAVFGHNH